jgi:glycosyltransferase involved in cell wall biosynthesis
LLFPRKIPLTKRPVSYGNPFFLKHGLDPFPLSLLGYFTRRFFLKRVKRLAQVIQTTQPDVIHSIEMQAESYPLLEAREVFGGKFPAPWIVSSWGSDIYYYKNFPEHLPRIEAVLGACDYFIPDCQRDAMLARQHGFRGEIPGVYPGPGGFHIDKMQKFIPPGRVTLRRLIVLKGYHGWAGRALAALDGLQRCAEDLRDYEIIVYLVDPLVEKEVRTLQRVGLLNIRTIPRSPFEDILKLLGRSRLAISVNITDGTPSAMLEAMTMHALPIQADQGSIGEWIEDGVNGLIVDPNNPESIARAVRRAIQDDTLVESAAQINDRIVRDRIDFKLIQPKVIEMYQHVASGKMIARSQ